MFEPTQGTVVAGGGRALQLPHAASPSQVSAAPNGLALPSRLAQGTISTRVREACGGMSVAAVSRATGFHPETVRRYVRGQAPSAEFLAALVDRMGVNPEWLLCGRGHPTGAPGLTACAS